MAYMFAAALTAVLGVGGAAYFGAWHFDGSLLLGLWMAAVVLVNALVRPSAILIRVPLTVATLALLLLAANAVLLGLLPLLLPGMKLLIPVLALGAAGLVAIANATWAGAFG